MTWIGKTWVLLVLAVGCRAGGDTRPAPSPAAPPVTDAAVEREVDVVAALGEAVPRQASLDQVAAAVAQAASEEHGVPAAAVRAAMATVLGSGRRPHVLAGRGSDREIAAQLRAALDELQGTVALEGFGVAIATGRTGRVGVVVALPAPSVPVTIERLDASARLSMVWPWAEAPSVFAVTPMSARRLTAVAVAGQLQVGVDCARSDEAIEISAGTVAVAIVVAPCGAVAEAPVPAGGGEGIELGPPATTRVEIEQRLFELVNRERAAHGRAALHWDERAHGFARAHAADMAGGGYVGHRAPDGAALVVRVERAGVSAWTTRENVGHAGGPGEVHLAFLRSPGHRANLLADDVTHGAVGVAPDPRAPGDFYVTEFFLSPRP